MERKTSWKSDLLLRSKNDPVFFIEQVLGSTLWDKQKEICYAVRDHERVACPASFGVGKCYDVLTQILTEDRGWQFFKDLLPTDKVASLVNGALQFVLPEDHFEGDYDGELLGCKSKQLDFLVTPNHRCLVATGGNSFAGCGDWHIEEAQDIYGSKRVYFNKEIIWEGLEDEWTEQHYELWGFWFADGSINGPYQIWITQKQYIEYAKNLLSVYKTPDVYDKGNGGKILSIGSKKLVDWFIENFGRNKTDRRIPKWIKQATKEKQRAFLRGFFRADGSYIDRHGESYGPTPAASIYYEGLAEDIAEVAMKAGYGTTIRKVVKWQTEKQFGGVRQVTYWIVSLLKNSTHLVGGQNNWYTEDYKGKIYCVKVPSGIILVRRNGLYHWSGNTYLSARLALWWLFCHPQSKVVSTAPTQRQIKDLLWSELRTAYNKSNIKLGGELFQLMLRVSDDHFAVGFSTDSENIDKFSGYHAPHQLVIFDQAAGIDSPIWEAAEGLMTSEHCRWLTISNTAISSSEMANICMPDRKTRFGDWKVIKIKATESPNVVAGKNVYPGLVAADWVKRREEAWGRDDPLYKIFVEAEFIPDSEMVVVPYEFITKAFEFEGEPGAYIEVGLDVARMGTDSSVWVARSGSKSLEVKRMTGNTTMQVVGETVEFKKYLEEKYTLPVLAIKVDVIGLGAGVYDRLIELDLPVVAVNNSEVHSMVDKERYSNIRAEMAWAFRYRMEHFGVGLSSFHTTDYEIKEYVRGDIQAIRYKITSQGKIQIAQKDEIRKILGRSPDYWDALVLAYESPGGGPPSIEFIPSDPHEEKDMSEEDWRILLGIDVPIDHASFHEFFS
jgi:phage terminase large subunit